MLRRVFTRALSTAGAPAPAAVAAEAAPALTGPKLLTPQAFKDQGRAITSPWNRYQVDSSSGYTLEEARKSQGATWIDTPTVVGRRKAIIYKVSQHAMTSGSSSQNWGIRFA